MAVQRIIFSGASVILVFKKQFQGTLLPSATGAAERLLFNGAGALAIPLALISTEIAIRSSLNNGKKAV